MTCKDCIHFEVCGFTSITRKIMEKDCKQFKNKANFMEVVRCKDCKWYIPHNKLDHNEYPNPIKAGGLCDNTDKYTDETDFCSCGERKDAE